MELKHFRWQVVDQIGTATFNRPPANSLSIQVMREIKAIAAEARRDEDVRAVLFRSDLEKYFCAGADITMFTGQNIDSGDNDVVSLLRCFSDIENLPLPTIAEVSGHAYGGGVEWALSCDFRFGADADYKIGLTESNLGILPAAGGTQRLPRLVGKQRALKMMFFGERWLPRDALEAGFFDTLVAPGDLHEEALTFARRLAERPTRSLGWIKRCVHEGLDKGVEHGLDLESEAILNLIGTEDCREGVMAFFEKRKPMFKGK